MSERKVPKIRFPGFTDDWEQRQVADIASDTRGGGTPATSNEAYWNGDIPWIQSSDLTLGKVFDVQPRKHISKAGLNGSAAQLIAEQSIAVVTRVGVGKLAYMPYSYATSQDFLSLCRLQTEPCFTVYGLYQMLQRELSTVQGTSIKGMTKEDLLSKVILLPKNINEQAQIGAYFKSLDNFINLHQRELDKWKELKKGMLQKMFPKEGESVPEIRFPGFTDSWKQHKLLRLLVQPVSDGPHETPVLVDHGIPFISVEAIVDNRIDFDRMRGYITEEYDKECRKKYSPQRDDVYLVKSGATVGKVAIVETDMRFNIWSPLAAMRTNNELMLPKYLYYYLQLKVIQDEIYEKSIGGTQPNLSMRVLERFIIKVPNVDEQAKIINVLGNIDTLITLHQREIDNWKQLKKALLQQMFV